MDESSLSSNETSDSESDSASDTDEDESSDQSYDSSDSFSSDDETENDGEQSTPDLVDIPLIGEILRRCRKTINVVNKSSIIHAAVEKMARPNINVNLTVDMKVRWGSTNKMIEHFLIYRPILDKLIDALPSLEGLTKHQKKKLSDLQLSDNEWTTLEVLSNTLQMFARATEMLSGSTYPSLAMAYPVLHSLRFYLGNPGKSPMENTIKAALTKSFDKYIRRSADSRDYQYMLVRTDNSIIPIYQSE